MTATQVSLFQLDNYGPWTVTPEPRPEPQLQALQARLYADLADAVGSRGGYVFYTRFDNVVAVTNGIDREAHRRIQEQIGNQYPVTVSAAVASDASPAAALALASERLQGAGSAQDAAREAALVGDPLGEAGEAHVAHFDVVDVTGKYTDEIDAYGAYLRVTEAVQALSAHMYEANDALTFFVGGDNAIAVCPDLSPEAYEAAIDHVEDETGVELQVGVGHGPTAREAGMDAKHALEACRREGMRVAGLHVRAD